MNNNNNDIPGGKSLMHNTMVYGREKWERR